MKRNGFTLIELLAVIVILAIIAVIAVPIIIDIIEDSKKNATLRSAEMYMDAVELSIADRVMHHGAIPNRAYPIMNDGNICLETYEEATKKCVDSDDDGTDIDILKVEVKGEKPTSGTIAIENGEIINQLSTDRSKQTQLEISNQTIVKNEAGELEYLKLICTYDESSTIAAGEIGAKYICDPGDGVSRTFYLLEFGGSFEKVGESEINLHENEDYIGTSALGEVSLIMSENIDNETVAWSSDGSVTNGPVTALNELKEKTTNSGWTVEVHLPTFDQIFAVNGQGLSTWLIGGINDPMAGETEPYGYWLSTNDNYGYFHISFLYNLSPYESPEEEASFGVRPVITISADQLDK